MFFWVDILCWCFNRFSARIFARIQMRVHYSFIRYVFFLLLLSSFYFFFHLNAHQHFGRKHQCDVSSLTNVMDAREFKKKGPSNFILWIFYIYVRQKGFCVSIPPFHSITTVHNHRPHRQRCRRCVISVLILFTHTLFVAGVGIYVKQCKSQYTLAVLLALGCHENWTETDTDTCSIWN